LKISAPPPDDPKYFEHWRNPYEVAAPIRSLERYVGLNDRRVIVPGYFQDTLNDAVHNIKR